jgi:hypothetical protein
MKKLFLSLVLLATITPLFCDSTDKTISNAISAEYAKLNELYKIAIVSNMFPQTNTFDFEYYINRTETDMQTLQQKIRSNESGWSTPDVKISFFAMILITSLMIYTYPLPIKDVLHKVYTGKFGTIDIDYDSIATTLPSLKFSRAQRKKLDRIHAKPKIIYTNDDDYNNHPVARWSEAEHKKLLYFTRNQALRDAYFQMFLMGITFTLGIAPFLLPIIDAVIHHQEHLTEQLTCAKARYQYLMQKKQEHLEQERTIEAYRAQKAYLTANRAQTLSIVEI